MYAYYGNAPEVWFSYNSFCLFVEVGEPGKRSVQPHLEPPSDDSDEGPSNEKHDSDDDDDDSVPEGVYAFY